MTFSRTITTSITAHKAVENSPTLGHLTRLLKESSARLVSIESLIPEALRPAVKAGPIDGETWCLLVHGNAAAAKVRQLIPRIQSRLGQEGWMVTSIRLKILIANNSQKVVLDGFSQVQAGKLAARVKERG